MNMVTRRALFRRWMQAILMWTLGFLTSSAEVYKPFTVGVDANYSLGMEADGKTWKWDGKQEDLFTGMATRGVKGFRVRLWTGDEGVNGKQYATQVVKRSLAAGLDPYLVIFLSEDWADMVKQPAPAIWKNLPIPERAAAVKAYSREIVAHFRSEGLRSHLYEIGNEIDYGICGVFPGKSTKKTPVGLSREHWPQAVQIIKASQEGVLESDPEAKFMLHIAHWWDLEFCTGFFQFMLKNGARVDYAGLSYFPSSNIGGSLEMAQFGEVVTRLHAAIQRKIIVAETAYPSTSDFKGQFSRWKKETPGYPLSPDGQRRWIADFLGYCSAHPAVESVYYWSPEWCGEGMWKGFALFDINGMARPAWSSFAESSGTRRPPRESLFFELAEGHISAVPLASAKERARSELIAILSRHPRVDTDYIREISEANVVVDGYKLHLRASLSGNLDLTRIPRPAERGMDEWKKVLRTANPATTRLVLFTRSDEGATAFAEAASALGFESIRHPLPPDAPLKFGLGQEWQKSVVRHQGQNSKAGDAEAP